MDNMMSLHSSLLTAFSNNHRILWSSYYELFSLHSYSAWCESCGILIERLKLISILDINFAIVCPCKLCYTLHTLWIKRNFLVNRIGNVFKVLCLKRSASFVSWFDRWCTSLPNVTLQNRVSSKEDRAAQETNIHHQLRCYHWFCHQFFKISYDTIFLHHPKTTLLTLIVICWTQ